MATSNKNVYHNVVTGATVNPVMQDLDQFDQAFAAAANRVLSQAVELARTLIGAHQAAIAIIVQNDWSSVRKFFSLSEKYVEWAEYQTPAVGFGIHGWLIRENKPIRLTQSELSHRTENDMSADKTISQQIDAIIKEPGDWRSKKLSQLRALIKKADPAVVEEVKWKKPSRPSGVPVGSQDGNICIADTLKNAVRLTFPKGAQMKDPKKLFNTRLDSNTVRAIDFHEDDTVDEAALKALILEAVRLNKPTTRAIK